MPIENSAKSPEQICDLFQRAMAEGDIDSVLSVYDPEAAFVKESGEVIKGRDSLYLELEPLAAMKTSFDFTIKQVVATGGTALMHTEWTLYQPRPIRLQAIEVARRQPDG